MTTPELRTPLYKGQIFGPNGVRFRGVPLYIFHSFQLVLNVNFSSRTTSMDVQRNLEANVEKRTKDTYGPPPGKFISADVSNINTVSIQARSC